MRLEQTKNKERNKEQGKRTQSGKLFTDDEVKYQNPVSKVQQREKVKEEGQGEDKEEELEEEEEQEQGARAGGGVRGRMLLGTKSLVR